MEEDAIAAARREGLQAFSADRLSEEDVLCRFEFVQLLMHAGIEIEKSPFFRPFLRKWASRDLTSTSHLREIVPAVTVAERTKIGALLKARDFIFIIDGASTKGETLAVVVRTVDSETFLSKQVLAGLRIFAKSLDGEGIAEAVMSILVETHALLPRNALGCAHDRASSNTTALRSLKNSVGFKNMVDLPCLAHTIDNTGSKASTPIASEFVSHVRSMFENSPAAVALWESKAESRAPTGATTRWWSQWFTEDYIVSNFPLFLPWLKECLANSLCPAHVAHLLVMLEGGTKQVPETKNAAGVVVPAHTKRVPPVLTELQFELAVLNDVGRPLVRATYALEGDDPCLVFEAFRHVLQIQLHLQVLHAPNAEAISARYKLSNHAEALLKVVRPVSAYFKEKFGDLRRTARSVGFTLSAEVVAGAAPALGDAAAERLAAAVPPGAPAAANGQLESTMKLFCLARLGDPWQLAALNPTVGMIDELGRVLPRLGGDEELKAQLKQELPAYMAAAVQLPAEKNVQSWWAAHRSALPAWSSLVQKLLLLCPSSAATERVFSIMRNSFDKRQEAALSDYIEGSCMLQYNNRDTSKSRQDRRAVL